MRKTTRQTGRFPAKDARGQVHVIDIFQEYIDTGQGLIEGVASLRTVNGHHVNRLDKGKYKIVETNVELTSDHPDCV
jgi:hypothetical protein